MSSTKIVIIVLILIGVLFVIFVVRGAVRNDPEPDKNARVADAEKQKPPDWTKKIEGLFNSWKPKRPLEKKKYSLADKQTAQEKIQGDTKQPFRTVKFHLLGGSANVHYVDPTPISDKSMKDLNDQNCDLPGKFNPDNPKADLSRCSIVALKLGGTVTITCKTSPCEVEVE